MRRQLDMKGILVLNADFFNVKIFVLSIILLSKIRNTSFRLNPGNNLAHLWLGAK